MKDYLTFFKESHARAIDAPGQREDFFDAFYDAFMSKSDEIARSFARTDMAKQKVMLHRSLSHMLQFSVERQATEELRRIARIHSKAGADLRPELYDVWLDSLLETVALFDPQFNEEIELAWRVVLAPGIAYMKFKYDKF